MECFNLAAALSLEVNFQMLDREIKKAVVFQQARAGFRCTWLRLGNKSVCLFTRMALADNAELIVLAPAVQMSSALNGAIDVLSPEVRLLWNTAYPRSYVKEDPAPRR